MTSPASCPTAEGPVHRSPDPGSGVDPGGRPLAVAVLGSTGSIGTSTLDVIEAAPDRFTPHLLAAQRSVGKLLEQARRLRPRWVVVTDPAAVEAGRHYVMGVLDTLLLTRDPQVCLGAEVRLDFLVGLVRDELASRPQAHRFNAGSFVREVMHARLKCS